jgi:hypothetical protein
MNSIHHKRIPRMGYDDRNDSSRSPINPKNWDMLIRLRLVCDYGAHPVAYPQNGDLMIENTVTPPNEMPPAHIPKAGFDDLGGVYFLLSLHPKDGDLMTSSTFAAATTRIRALGSDDQRSFGITQRENIPKKGSDNACA